MKKRLAAVLALVLSVFVLTSCGSSKYAGEWQMVSGSYNGTEVSMEQIEKLTGGKLKMILEEDGTAKIETGSAKAESKWEETKDGVIVYDKDKNDSSAVDYTFKDNRLVCSVGGIEMKLEKQ